jgi:hypothetical protein
MSSARAYLCWAELLAASRSGALAEEERTQLLDHIVGCGRCQRALFAVGGEGSLASLVSDRAMPEPASARIRGRLLARAAAERRGGVAAAVARVRATPVAGWLVAAGLASLLLLHHGFHRPLGLGWPVASVLGVLSFVLLVQLLLERRRASDLRGRLVSLERELRRARSRDDGPPEHAPPRG